MKKLSVLLLVLVVAIAGVFAQAAQETAAETKVEGFDSALIKAAQAEAGMISCCRLPSGETICSLYLGSSSLSV